MRTGGLLVIGWLSLGVFLASCQIDPKASGDTQKPYYTEQHRPRFHFSPDSMWMNDPNGMVYYDGEYHLFYQFHPYSNVWGPMHWGHAISTDLVHWEHLPIALYPDSLGTIFSGSAVIDRENTSGLGSMGNPPMVAIFTHHNQELAQTGSDRFQNQSIAYSLNRGRTWTKYAGNPVLTNPGIRDFRDPKVSWYQQGQKWIMVLAAFDRIMFYSSPDLIRWNKESEFTAQRAPGEGVWECPDFFPMKAGEEELWVLLVSIGGGGPNGGSGTKYYVGSFDGKAFTCTDPSCTPRWLDYGKDNYAGVTWSGIPEEDGRRIFMGWMSNWQYAGQVPTEKWRSAMTLPRELTLQKEGGGFVLVSAPVEEVKALVKAPAQLEPNEFTGRSPINLPGPDASQYDIELSFRISPDEGTDPLSHFGIVLENKLGQELVAGYDLGQEHVFIDRSRSGKVDFSGEFSGKHTAPYELSEEGILRFRVLVDHSSVELFVDDGKVVMTELFFPDEPYHRMHIYANEGIVALESGSISAVSGSW